MENKYSEENNLINRSKVINKVLICVKPFSMISRGDYFYCYAIDDNNNMVGYSTQHQIEFRIPISFLSHFRID